MDACSKYYWYQFFIKLCCCCFQWFICIYVYSDTYLIISILNCLYCKKNIKSNTGNLKCNHCYNHCHITCIKDKDHNTNRNFICNQCVGQELPFNCMIYNDEFINVIIEYQQTPKKRMFEKLNEILFDPFGMNTDVCDFNEDDYEYLCNGITNLNCK